MVAEAGIVQATGNVFHGAPTHTIALVGTTASFNGNHILKGAGNSVWLYYATPQPVHVDMRSNCWGTASADSIARWIWDGHDDPSITAFVDYLPFSSTPLPAEKKSLGSVKALFR
jgi:hypothetical protein